MTRWIAVSAGALALALTLGLALPFANEASADGFKAPSYSAPRHKRCIAPSSGWGWFRSSQTTWVCGIAEKCCYDRVLRKGHCLPASDRCF